MEWGDWSVRALAEKAGVKPSSLQDWRNGALPNALDAQLVAAAIGVTTYEVAWGETEPLPDIYPSEQPSPTYVPVQLRNDLMGYWWSLSPTQRGEVIRAGLAALRGEA